MSYRIGIDVGGTFTDFLLIGPDDLRLVHKTSSTPDDPSVGFVTGLGEIAALLELDLPALLARTEVMVHGTTVTTNAVLTRRGAATGLLATKGFRDALALRNGLRESPYDNRLQPPEPLVPRYLRAGVEERTDYAGDEVVPLAEGDVRAACELFRAEGVEAVAISFMHSPAGPAHERSARDLCRELLPGAYVTASSDLLPQVRYYDRTSTTVLNAYVGPIITGYLRCADRPARGARLRRRAADHAVERRCRHACRGLASAPRSRSSPGRRRGPRRDCGSSPRTGSPTASRSTWGARASTRPS